MLSFIHSELKLSDPKALCPGVYIGLLDDLRSELMATLSSQPCLACLCWCACLCVLYCTFGNGVMESWVDTA